MVAILENGRHFEILRGTRYFLNKGPRKENHAHFGACITILKIVSVICSTSSGGSSGGSAGSAGSCGGSSGGGGSNGGNSGSGGSSGGNSGGDQGA